MLRNIVPIVLLPLTCAAFACTQGDAGGAEGGAPEPVESAASHTSATSDGNGGSRASGDYRPVVLFLGTSLTAGYGLGPSSAFPAIIQEKIDSAGLPFRVVNAGLSGETSAGGLRRLDWSLQDSVDVFVLELGANDGLRGLEVSAMRANLDSILTRTRRRYPEASLVVLGMEAPPNLGNRYTSSFRETFRSLSGKHDAALVPFLLDGVAAVPALNLADGLHPNAEGHQVLARNVWRILGPLLQERAGR